MSCPWSDYLERRFKFEGAKRDLALFNMAIDSKLRGCDLVRLEVSDVCVGGRMRTRTAIVQSKTGRPVQFERTDQTRTSIQEWPKARPETAARYLFPSRFHDQPHITTRHCARILRGWAEHAGLDSSLYGTHLLRRTKVAQIYRKTGNSRAVQLLLGHTKLESTVRYLGIEVEDALALSEQTEV